MVRMLNKFQDVSRFHEDSEYFEQLLFVSEFIIFVRRGLSRAALQKPPPSCSTCSFLLAVTLSMSLCSTAFLLVFQVAGGEGRGGGAQKRPEVSVCG